MVFKENSGKLPIIIVMWIEIVITWKLRNVWKKWQNMYFVDWNLDKSGLY